jgi:hypothetical protein
MRFSNLLVSRNYTSDVAKVPKASTLSETSKQPRQVSRFKPKQKTGDIVSSTFNCVHFFVRIVVEFFF